MAVITRGSVANDVAESSKGCVLCGKAVRAPFVYWNLPPADINAMICTECCCMKGLMADLVQVQAIAALNRIPGFEMETLKREKVAAPAAPAQLVEVPRRRPAP